MNRIAFSPIAASFPARPTFRGKTIASLSGLGPDRFIPPLQKAIGLKPSDRFEAVTSCRFRGDKSRGGTDYNEATYHDNASKTYPIIKAMVDQWDTLKLAELEPDIQKAYDTIGLSDWVGIPPLVSTKPAQEDIPKKESRGILALVIFKLLESFKPNDRSDSLEMALARMDQAFDLITERAHFNRSQVNTDKFSTTHLQMNRDAGESTLAMKPDLYSCIYSKHIVVAAKNGAIQVLRLPSTAQIVKMIENDPEAQRYIDTERPLSYSITEQFRWGETDTAGTLFYLNETIRNKPPTGFSAEGKWTDIHTLVTKVPFDFGKHIQSGILKPMSDIPGKDGRTVWQKIVSDHQSNGSK